MKSIIDSIKDDLNLPASAIKLVLVHFFKQMRKEFEEDSLEVVRIPQFGKFEVIERNKKMGRHPITKEPLVIPPRKLVKFSSLHLKKNL